MLKPIYKLTEIAHAIEKQTGQQVISISNCNNYDDQQEFLVLEWMNNKEYVVRKYFRHLTQKQPFGVGSGVYLKLYDKFEDGLEAFKKFDIIKKELA